MNPRPVLVAPDKFKGTFSATEVADAVADGLARIDVAADVCRIADGGEGTIDVVREVVDGELAEVDALDALGNPTHGRVFVFDDGKSALVEVSEAIGLAQIPQRRRDAIAASSAGAGRLIVEAAATGVRDVFVGIGGTATTDGGAGALDLMREARLIGKRGRLKKCPRITVLCDVRAAWEQAPTVFSPQKGASREQVKLLSLRMDEFARTLPNDPRGKLMTGSGGGLSGGLWAAADAVLKSGSGWVLDRVGFSPRMTAARAVITGEGSLDRQTLLGKAVGEVATRARQSGVPCHAIVGQMGMTEFDARILDFESWTKATTLDAISTAAANLGGQLAPR
ncbi:MAG: glycerate kinase [Solirubrobacterales bacterium]